MTHEIIRKASHAYLVLKEDLDTSHEISYETVMLEKWPIDGLLSFSEGHLNGCTLCQYEITGLTPLPAAAGLTPFSEEDIRKILLGLLETIDTLEDCLLTADHLLLDPEFCYFSSVSGKRELKVPYVPFIQQDIFRSLADFSTYLAAHANKDSQDAIVLACRIRHELQEPNVVLSQLKPYLHSENESPPDTFAPFSDAQTEDQKTATSTKGFLHPSLLQKQLPDRFTLIVALCGIPAAVLVYFALHFYAFWPMRPAGKILLSITAAGLIMLLILLLRKVLPVKPVKEPDGLSPASHPEMPSVSGNFEPVSGEDGCTVLLSDYLASKGPVLPRLEPCRIPVFPDEAGESEGAIVFDKSRLLIGSSGSLCDKTIDDPTVSRLHAEVFCLQGLWYIFDINSKNGTFLNREMIPADKKVPLNDGDIVRFGAAEYVFREEKT